MFRADRVCSEDLRDWGERHWARDQLPTAQGAGALAPALDSGSPPAHCSPCSSEKVTSLSQPGKH